MKMADFWRRACLWVSAALTQFGFALKHCGAGVIFQPFDWRFKGESSPDGETTITLGPVVILLYWPWSEEEEYDSGALHRSMHEDGIVAEVENTAVMRQAQTLLEFQRGIIDGHLATIDKYDRFLDFIRSEMIFSARPSAAEEIARLMRENGFEPAPIDKRVKMDMSSR